MNDKIASIMVVPASASLASIMLGDGVCGAKPPVCGDWLDSAGELGEGLGLVLLWGTVAVGGIDRLCRAMDGAPPIKPTAEYALMLAREAERLGVGRVVLLDQYRQEIKEEPAPVVSHRTTPAELIREHLTPRNWSVAQLAFAMRPLVVDMRRLARVVDGRDPITKYMARRLATALDTTEAYWLELQAEYDKGSS